MFTLDFFHYEKFDVILRVIFELRIYKVQIDLNLITVQQDAT